VNPTTTPVPAPSPTPLAVGEGRDLAGLLSPVPALRWSVGQLPAPVFEMRTVTRHRLVVRLVRPGDPYGHTARLAGTPLVEVRRWDLINESLGDPGEVLAVWDLTLLLEEPRSVWHLFTPGFAYAVPDGTLEDMYAAVHAIATSSSDSE
jgi:hypothetical protein